MTWGFHYRICRVIVGLDYDFFYEVLLVGSWDLWRIYGFSKAVVRFF